MALEAVERRVVGVDPGFREGLGECRCSAIENSMSDSTPMISARSTRECFSTAGILSPCAARSKRSMARERYR